MEAIECLKTVGKLLAVVSSSNRPLRSINRRDLLVPRIIIPLAKSRSFTSIGPTLWNAVSPYVRSSLPFFKAVFHLPLPFLKLIFSYRALHTGSASARFTPLETLYTCLSTIQCNTIVVVRDK